MSLKFTENTKSTLDLIVPVAGVGIGAYYFFKNKKADAKQALIAGAILLVVLYVVTTQITKRLLGAAQKPPDLNVIADVPGTTDNNNSTAGAFNATAWAQRLYDDMKPFNWFSTGHDYQLYADTVVLSNQSLLLVYNAWQSKFYSQYKNKTLIQAMKDESWPNIIDGTSDKVDIIINRLTALGAV